MSRKYLIVGGVAGGASTAARLRRLSERDRIIMFERGPHVSFSNCSLPYHLSGTVENADSLVLMSPEKFLNRYNIEARINSEVVWINKEKKEVEIKNLITGEVYIESYNKLILSPGAKPILLPIPGIEKLRVFTVRNVGDIVKLNDTIKGMNPGKVTVIGGGFIGVECAENLAEGGYEVSLVEAMPQILKQFDYEMVQILHKELSDHGVDLVVNDRVTALGEDRVILSSGREIESGIVIMAIGVTPETDLATGAGLRLGTTGAIGTDSNFMTSDPDIYAVGDAIEVYNPLMERYVKLPLAGPAQKQARSAADHIHGKNVKNRGYIGSSAIKVFNYTGAATGLSEHILKEKGTDYDTVRIIPKDKVGLMPDSEDIHLKLIFEKPTGRVLGAQAIGRGNVDKRIDVIATVIKFGGTVEDLKDLELCYAPPVGTAKDAVNLAGYVAVNLLEGRFSQVPVSKIRELVDEGAYILDVREESEYVQGHIRGAENIPLSEIRGRLHEIPRDRSIYIHCKSGQRSYNAALILGHEGFKKVFNISGGFMGISFTEYFDDVVLGRTPIVTEYNFK